MTDLVKALREASRAVAAIELDYPLTPKQLDEAADEIERLEHQLFVDIKAEEENIKLRAALLKARAYIDTDGRPTADAVIAKIDAVLGTREN